MSKDFSTLDRVYHQCASGAHFLEEGLGSLLLKGNWDLVSNCFECTLAFKIKKCTPFNFFFIYKIYD